MKKKENKTENQLTPSDTGAVLQWVLLVVMCRCDHVRQIHMISFLFCLLWIHSYPQHARCLMVDIVYTWIQTGVATLISMRSREIHCWNEIIPTYIGYPLTEQTLIHSCIFIHIFWRYKSSRRQSRTVYTAYVLCAACAIEYIVILFEFEIAIWLKSFSVPVVLDYRINKICCTISYRFFFCVFFVCARRLDLRCRHISIVHRQKTHTIYIVLRLFTAYTQDIVIHTQGTLMHIHHGSTVTLFWQRLTSG